jgi:radical SAM-linked protein
LKQQLKIPGVFLKWQKPEMSAIEGLLARGDRRMGSVIEQAWKKGCTFDGWNDQFKFNLWQEALDQCKLTQHFFTTRSREIDEPLPWQHMNVKIHKSFFKQQWEAAIKTERVDDCRNGKCHQCGVCDFDKVEPKVFKQFSTSEKIEQKEKIPQYRNFVWRSLKYTKLGDARLFGHLELSHIFSRALRRANISVEYSKGFHPMPKISFDDPLPLGIESQAEYMRISVSTHHQCANIMKDMNAHLPEGVQIMDCQLRSETKRESEKRIERYSIQLMDQKFEADVLKHFNRCESWTYVRTNHKGRIHHIDMKKVIGKLICSDGDTLIYETVPKSEYTIRPADIIVGIFDMPADILQNSNVIKLDPLLGKSAVDI